MSTQNQIKRKLSEHAAIEYVSGLLDEDEFNHRTELADFLCEQFEFYDARGQEQRSGCLKALRELEASGYFTLPDAWSKKGPSSPRRLSAPVPDPEGVPEKAGAVRGLRLELVGTVDDMRIWNEMMIGEHPRGHGPLVGRQVRYLIGSEYGWLGALGFAAPALQLAERDRWIGWDVEHRRSHLHSLVGMSRFLIRPSIKCYNLASRLLTMVMQRLPEDFEQCYNYRPLLVETFVDTSRNIGTCYRAANWIRVGRTRGRGRQDRYRNSTETVKDIYVYPLEKDFRSKMELSEEAGLGPLGPSEGLDPDSWAQKEFGDAPVGDGRLSKRLVSVAESKAENPGSAFTSVAHGDPAAVKGYYRFIDMPDDSAVTMENILKPHRERTVRRMLAQQTVLCIQDGTDLNYTNLDQCEGLGVVGTNQTGAKSRGLHLHSTLAVAPNGVPLGVIRAKCTAPQPRSPKDNRLASAIPIEEKKTFCWIEGLRDIAELATEMPHTRLISVCDREADFFELFDEQLNHPGVELLVRAKHNRNLSEGPLKLFETLRAEPVRTQVNVRIPRQSARPKKSKQKARPKRPGRKAKLSVHTKRIELRPPGYLADKQPIDIWVIHALEDKPPRHAKAVEWFLLTTVDASSPEEAVSCLRWYCLRWRIEDWHRVLKSGCAIEEIGHKSAERLRRAIAINLVIAWRIMLMTLLGRETPEQPAEVLFTDIELEVLRAYSKKKGLKEISLLGEATRLVARIGGYMGRTHDPPPGHQLMWEGYRKIKAMCEGYALRDD